MWKPPMLIVRASAGSAWFTFGTVKSKTDGKPWSTQDWFDPWNTSIHGISETDVRNSLTLPEVRDDDQGRGGAYQVFVDLHDFTSRQ